MAISTIEKGKCVRVYPTKRIQCSGRNGGDRFYGLDETGKKVSIPYEETYDWYTERQEMELVVELAPMGMQTR